MSDPTPSRNAGTPTPAIPATPAPTMGSEADVRNRLEHMPVPLFAVVLGLAGLGLAWRQAGAVAGAAQWIGGAILVLAAAAFGLIAAAYLGKAIRHAAEVAADFNHPVRVNFFPAISISLLLLAVAAGPHNTPLATGLFLLGAALHLGLMLVIVRRWVLRDTDIAHSNPAWFIPAVGNIVVPIAGVPLGFVEFSWFFFAIGIGFWILLFSIVFYRLVFHAQLPAKLTPTLFILIAPPSVGYIAYAALTGGEIDTLARILFYFGLFMTALVACLADVFVKAPFAVSWWAVTFPADAIAIAALDYRATAAADGLAPLAWFLLAAATVIVALVTARTVAVFLRGCLLIPE